MAFSHSAAKTQKDSLLPCSHEWFKGYTPADTTITQLTTVNQPVDKLTKTNANILHMHAVWHKIPRPYL